MDVYSLWDDGMIGDGRLYCSVYTIAFIFLPDIQRFRDLELQCMQQGIIH